MSSKATVNLAFSLEELNALYMGLDQRMEFYKRWEEEARVKGNLAVASFCLSEYDENLSLMVKVKRAIMLLVVENV